jgi:hypothetical protein
MYLKKKYVITRDEVIIVFPELIEHHQFSNFEPVSAGFISFGTDDRGQMKCQCYGKSISLRIESRPEEDTRIAMQQLGMNY